MRARVCVKVEGNKNKVEGFSFLFAFWRQLYPFCVFSNCSLSMELENMATRVLAPVTETPRPRQAGPRARLLMIRPSHQIPFSHSVMSGSCNPMDCSLPGSSVYGIPREEYWPGLPFPTPRDLPSLGSNPHILSLLHWQADSLPTVPPGKLPTTEYKSYLYAVGW